MNRPRRRTATPAATSTAVAAQGEQPQQQPPQRMGTGCDGTALALVGGEGAEAEMERRARGDEPEEIDTEEDDAEFDERAHWGRRRAKAKRTGKAGKKKVVEEDKTQPKINMFCVARMAAAAGTQGEQPEAESHAADGVVVVEQLEDDGNGGCSVVEVLVQATTNGVALNCPVASPVETQVMSPANETERELETAMPPVPSPGAEMMQSGRPKRQAVLRAEQAQLKVAEEALFMTPPALQPTKKSSASKATLDGEPERRATNGGSASLSSSGRKRKLEMAGEKKTAGQQTIATALNGESATAGVKSRANVFFLTEEQKKQVIEIDAVASFKKQLREQRERDLAFFGSREVKNPFFHARATTQKAIDVDATEVIEVLDTPESSPAKPRKSKWAKDAILFPSVQHTICHAEDGDSDTALGLVLPSKKAREIVVLEPEDETMEDAIYRPTMPKFSPDEADAQVPFDDLFWLLSSSSTGSGNDLVLASLGGALSSDELVERLSEGYGIKDKRVRKILAALELARTKREDKAHNLSLVDRYLPVQTHGMVGNKTALKKLTAWLSAWKSGGGNDRDRRYDDDLCAFEGDDSDDDEDGTQLYRLFILQGDVASGKSAAVYACAEELGYEIIEINAGQLRTGKAIVDIAGEATQSTRVLHSGGPVNDSKNKKKKKSSKKRRIDEAAKPSHLSLVLFEDVDLVFDDDKGFLSTLGSIAKHSKCPIVVTCRHLPDSFPSSPPAISQSLSRPSTQEFSMWLSLVAILEGIPLQNSLVSGIAELYRCDVRRGLQFLQTYRERIGRGQQPDRSLVWKTTAQLNGTAVGSDANAPIHITDSQDENAAVSPPTPPQPVPAWSRSTLRSFDFVHSNFLPLLTGSVCESMGLQERASMERVDKERHVASLEEMWDVLDAVSLADEWESHVAQIHERNIIQDDAGADYFHAQAVQMLTLDVRMLSLSSFAARRERSPDVLSLRESSLTDAVDRALRASREADDRLKKKTRLAALKTKLELPPTVKGSEQVGSRFALDYIPMVARISDSSEPLQESRRRASRRNHYLRDVMSDMSAVEDIRAFHACFPPTSDGPDDEIIPLSASSSAAAAETSICI